MSRYQDRAMERRQIIGPDGKPAYNCCQSVATVFAEELGYDEEASMKAATSRRRGARFSSERYSGVTKRTSALISRG